MELIDKGKDIHHLAGIIPVAGMPLDFKMPWHDSLMPVGKDYLALERAVYQCALAGCETIWIVGYLGTQPLLKKRVGDTILDPYTVKEGPNPLIKQKEVSIYYVPIHPKDRSKRDSLGWSVLYGADSAYRISKFISKWIAPEKFFCCFPYSIMSDEDIKANRSLLSSKENIIFSHGGKTVKDNLHIPFTFIADDFFRCRDIVKHKQAKEWGIEGSARHYDLATVFKGLDSVSSTVVELSQFHDVSSWESYRKYIASEQCNIEKPKHLFLGKRRNKFDKGI